MRPTPILVALALALALAPGIALADARLDWQRQGTCPVLFASIDIAGSRLRFDLPAEPGEPFWSVFDGEEDLVTTVIPSQQTYMTMEVDADAADYMGDVGTSTVTFMDRQMAQAREQIAQMQKNCHGRGCPQVPDLDAMMAMATGGAQPAIEARDTTETGDANGVACAWREWVQAGQVVRRECLAKVAELPLADADRGGFARGMKVMTHYGDSFGAVRDRFGLAKEPAPPPGQLAVAQVCFAGGSESGRATMVMAPTAVDPARFEIPPGYHTAVHGAAPGAEGP
jgi:hypothetical protein